MIDGTSIRVPLLSATLLLAAGCASTPQPLRQTPLGQTELDQFLAGGRDARYYGITIYPDDAGPRFEFANRVHQDRAAQMDFASPRRLHLPVISARTATFVDFLLLLDSSARQNWLAMPSAKAIDYRTFAPPLGEYPDHVASPIPGYAGVANKIVLDELHVESPLFYVPPARGNLGPLVRVNPDPNPSPASSDRRALGSKIHAVMGAALLRSFAYVRFDFPARAVRFSTHSTYKPPSPPAVLANLPLRDWRGRPAITASLGGAPLLLVIDTAGDFDLSLPGAADGPAGPLLLGDWQIDDLRIQTHASLGLPETFPARIGLGLLARGALTRDHTNPRVWFEAPLPAAPPDETPSPDDAPPEPIHYRGVSP